MELRDIKNVFFVGVGGIGMSALARYFISVGKIVMGYDKTQTSLTTILQKEGISILFQDDEKLLPTILLAEKKQTLVVYTPAIPANSDILNFFQRNQFVIEKRAAILGMITKNSINLSVAGTHGKTTTSSMLAAIFKRSDKTFYAFLGGISADLESNYYHKDTGSNQVYTITEADEYDRSFLQLSPSFAAITATDADHLDIYGNKEEIEKTFTQFIELVPKIENRFFALEKCLSVNGQSYSASNTSADVYAENIDFLDSGSSFDIIKDGSLWFKKLKLNIAGIHNIENALAAILLADKAGISSDVIRQGLENFKGIKRRFEFVVKSENCVYIDDYAHHPNEIKSLINSVKKIYPDKRITAIFQPHLFTRTRDFLSEFAKELSRVDSLIVLPIYPARELPIAGVVSEVLLEQVTINDKRVLNKEEVLGEISRQDIEILLTIGAGDIDTLVQPLKELILKNICK